MPLHHTSGLALALLLTAIVGPACAGLNFLLIAFSGNLAISLPKVREEQPK